MSFVCPACRMESFNRTDEALGWCAICDGYTRDSPAQTRYLIALLRASGETIVAEAAERRMRRPGHPHVRGLPYQDILDEVTRRITERS